MPRRYDADLCRAKGWEVGDVLLFEDATHLPFGTDSLYVLSAVGFRAMLCRPVVYFADGIPMVGTRELKMSGQLHRNVIQKVGTFDGKTVKIDESPARLSDG